MEFTNYYEDQGIIVAYPSSEALASIQFSGMMKVDPDSTRGKE